MGTYKKKEDPRGINPNTYPDRGCEFYSTCLGNEEYPQCPFNECIEDLRDPESELYDRGRAIILKKWFSGNGK